jgi:hypothetical protein
MCSQADDFREATEELSTITIGRKYCQIAASITAPDQFGTSSRCFKRSKYGAVKISMK